MDLDVGRCGFQVSFIVVWHAIGILCTRLLRHLLKAALVVAQEDAARQDSVAVVRYV